MKSDKKRQILKAIRDDLKYSRNNRDMAYLQANGYIEATNVVKTSYVKATIKLSDWGKVWLEEEKEK